MIDRSKVAVGTITGLALATALVGPALADGLLASVDTRRLAAGETVTLTLTREGADTAAAPDLSPLAASFEVLGTATGSETRIVNGARTDAVRWTVALAPKEAGRLTVPALSAGGATSEPIEIEVSDAPSAAGATGPAGVGLRVEVAPGTHHEHESIPLTVTVTDALGVRDARLVEPAGEDFSLARVGEPTVRTAAAGDGRPVRVTELRYALTPRTVGSIVVPPIRLEGSVPDPSGRRSPFAGRGLPDAFAGAGFGRAFGGGLLDGMFDPGRPVAVRSEPVEIDVLPRPVGAGEWFLPAARVALSDGWAEAVPALRVGEAATRTVRLVALGASAEQLPELDLGEADGARLYVDRTRDRTVDTPDGPAAVREVDVSVVPTAAGPVTLPAIEVDWWDVNADVERVASLPARTIEALPGGAVAAAAGPSVAMLGTENPAEDVARDDPVPVPVAPDRPVATLAAAALAALGCAVSAASLPWLRRRRRARAGGVPAESSAARRRACEREIARAGRDGDDRRAYEAFRRWSGAVAPGTPVAALAGDVPAFAEELRRVEVGLYADASPVASRAGSFARAFARSRRRLRRAADESGEGGAAQALPALYPS